MIKEIALDTNTHSRNDTLFISDFTSSYEELKDRNYLFLMKAFSHEGYSVWYTKRGYFGSKMHSYFIIDNKTSKPVGGTLCYPYRGAMAISASGVRKPYQGKGLMTSLYSALIKTFDALYSDGSVSASACMLWYGLGKKFGKIYIVWYKKKTYSLIETWVREGTYPKFPALKAPDGKVYSLKKLEQVMNNGAWNSSTFFISASGQPPKDHVPLKR